ncbi:hypothetical protein DAPPUDRAFT_220226 [Daphnia pulex]|uniref:chitinase n=1 Tax=Daphnia pulex TaxID=6669 RepID=E9FR97_DAPPU|nr:hypothetical protein DAPPUDRAFT_220226 [Daphnia pulex]|eukprot:EFX90232.1 hypothetical protein DAPPUDRAFT_220226 [Daphnia pulex]
MKIVAILAFALLVTLANAQGNYKKVCYFANWPYYRSGAGQYGVDKLNAFECTHMIYGFAVLDKIKYEMVVYDSYVDIDLGGYQKFTGLKAQNPNLKTLIALGGWNDSAFTTQYSELVSDPAKMANFVSKALAFVRQYNFDGLDFDWEYPGDPGKPEDKANFITLLNMLRDAFKPYNLLLTMAPSCSIKRAEVSYDIPGIAAAVDFVNFMAYDIHGSWENTVDHHAPLYRRDFEQGVDAVIISEAVDYWLSKGMPAQKLIFGLPSYGRTFRLANASQTALLSPAIGAGPQGPYTGADGFLSLYEICRYQQSGWTVVIDPTGSMGPYAYQGTSWVSWDDIDMIITKVKYAMSKGLGGIMFWELTLDDFNGFCQMGPRPLSNAITATLEGRPFNTATPAPTPTPFPITTTKAMTCTSEGTYYADPANCSKYYRCVNARIQTYYCQSGLVFNSAINVCDWPYNVPGCA